MNPGSCSQVGKPNEQKYDRLKFLRVVPSKYFLRMLRKKPASA